MTAFFRQTQTYEFSSFGFSETIPQQSESYTPSDVWLDHLARQAKRKPTAESKAAASIPSSAIAERLRLIPATSDIAYIFAPASKHFTGPQRIDESAHERDLEYSITLCRNFEAFCVMVQTDADEWELQAIGPWIKSATKAAHEARRVVLESEKTVSHQGKLF